MDSSLGQEECCKMALDMSLTFSSVSLERQQTPGTEPSSVPLDASEGTPRAYQSLRFHSWPVDEVRLLVDHDRFGDGGHARASWRLWAWAKCLRG